MCTIEFSEVESIFEGIWCESRQMFWFEMAWDALTKQNLTTVDDEKNEILVYIRALTLYMIYEEFCDLVFEEYCEYDCYYEKIKDYVSEFQVGRLYGERYKDKFTDDVDYACCCLAESERRNVMSALLKDFDESKIFLGMYLTVYTPYSWLDQEEDDDDYYVEDGDCVIDTYEKYCSEIKNKANDLCNSLDINMMDLYGYSWICEGTYKVRDFYDCSYLY